jgi:hypothetical protein
MTFKYWIVCVCNIFGTFDESETDSGILSITFFVIKNVLERSATFLIIIYLMNPIQHSNPSQPSLAFLITLFLIVIYVIVNSYHVKLCAENFSIKLVLSLARIPSFQMVKIINKSIRR